MRTLQPSVLADTKSLVQPSSKSCVVAHRRIRKLDRPRVVQNSNQIYPIRWCSRADFPEPTQTVVALVPKVGTVGKHGIAESAKPIGVRYAAIAGRHKPLAVTPRKLSLCRAHSHPAVQAVGLAVLVRGAGPVAQNFVARKLKVHFPFPGWTGWSCLVRLVHHRDDDTSTSNRFVSGNLFHVESLKRGRNVVLGDVVRGGISRRGC